jgi:glycosyltransferase involved in cell wall biosynthesis
MKKKDRIIFVHFFNSFSGSPRVLESVVDVLKNKYECELITNNTNGFLDNLDVPKKTFAFDLSRIGLITFFKYLLGQLQLFFLVLKSSNKNDLVYINTSIPILGALAAKLRGAFVIFHLHEDTNSLNFVHRSLAFFRRFVCDYEIFVSNYLFEKEHISSKDYCVIHNCLPAEFLNNAQKRYNDHQAHQENFIVLMVCSLKKYKGILQLIEIAKLLEGRSEIFFHLVLDADQEMIDYFFDDIAIPSSFRIFASTSKISEHFQDSALLLNLSLPDSWVETFGLTILEGMAYSLPCIVPDVGGPRELVTDGDNGFRISAYESVKIAKQIIKIYEDKDLYNKLAASSRKKAKLFSFNEFEQKLLTCVGNIHPNIKENKKL